MKKCKKLEYKKRLELLEREGRFDEITTHVNTENVQLVDKKYEFLPKTLPEKLLRGAILGAFYSFGWLLDLTVYGLKIEDRKNLRKVKGKTGAITVSNHVLYLDTLVIKQTFGYSRTYMTGAAHNCKSGFAGNILKCGGFLALNGTYEAYKNLLSSMEKLLSDAKFVHFNPEESMWLYYEKPRPHKKGAYNAAVKFNVPVLPMFIGFKEGKIRKYLSSRPRVIVKILPPVYPDQSLPVHERVDCLKQTVETSYKLAYEKFYNKPLVYLCDENQNYNEQQNSCVKESAL